MSYILDALRKAERERHPGQTPTLETVHQVSPAARRRLWPWVGAGIVLLNVAALAWFLLRPAPVPVVETSAGSAAGRAAPEPPAVSGQPAASPPAGGIPRVRPPEEAAGVRAAPAPSPGSVSQRPQPERRPAAVPGGLEARPGPSAALAPGVSRAGPQKTRQADAPAASTPPATPEAPPTSREQSSVSLPAPQDVSRAAQDVISKFKLQVLVYSDAPADRMVFINGRKYLEGQSIDDKIVVERITPDGAILSSQGQRVMLRQ